MMIRFAHKFYKDYLWHYQWINGSSRYFQSSCSQSIDKILIANRGEISIRVARTAKKMGLNSVSVYADDDRNSMHVLAADEAVSLGSGPTAQTYLNMNKIIETAINTNSQAIHPGYGFLSENADFAEKCLENNIIFIGPPPSAIRDMGIKSISKRIMSAAGVPVIPGYHGDDQNDDLLAKKAIEIGFPVMIKAIKGGGGKGMRISFSLDDFYDKLDSARRESLKSFGDDSVLIEKFITSPRHVEVQIFADNYGNTVHLFERDCSIQRRHQKIIEEAPGPKISQEIRQNLGEAAIAAAKAVKYVGAGTVEFIFDNSDQKFYFMEMNTRIQVEHPVTEMITGTDLVELQIRVAKGETLPELPIKPNGHAFEARIYAEDPLNNFLPEAGIIQKIVHPPIDQSIRIETGVQSGTEVSVYYDPMIAKLIVWGENRNSALAKLRKSLNSFHILGLKNNITFLSKLSSHSDFVEGNCTTNFIDEHKEELLNYGKPTDLLVAACSIGLLLSNSRHYEGLYDSFRNNKYMPSKKIFTLHGDKEYKTVITKNSGGKYNVEINGNLTTIDEALLKNDKLVLKIGNYQKTYYFLHDQNSVGVFGNENCELKLPITQDEGENEAKANNITAPMPGVIEKIFVKPGDMVEKGDTLVILIAMKMEFIIKSDRKTIIADVLYNEKDTIPKGSQIVTFKD